jgi:hypothetical protein
MSGRCSQGLSVALVCLLVSASGCSTRKGFVIGADLKLEFNRVPWRTGPDGQYEVGGPDCLVCPGPHGGRRGPTPCANGEGCPPAPLPGDCGLPPVDPHPRSRFHPLPMHDVLHGGAPALLPGEVIVGEEIEGEAVPPPPAKSSDRSPSDKSPSELPGNPARSSPPPFQLEEEEPPTDEPRSTQAEAQVRSVREPPAPRNTPRSAVNAAPRPWTFVQPSNGRRPY